MGYYKKHLYIKEVLKLYNLGVPKKEIALKVGVTEKTVALWIKKSVQQNSTLEKRIALLEKEIKSIKIQLKNHD